MQACPTCGEKKVHERTVRDEEGRVVETATVCSSCGHVLQVKAYPIR